LCFSNLTLAAIAPFTNCECWTRIAEKLDSKETVSEAEALIAILVEKGVITQDELIVKEGETNDEQDRWYGRKYKCPRTGVRFG